MNLYATALSLRTTLGLEASDDAELLRIIRGASRAVDRFCGGGRHRHFYTAEETRTFEITNHQFVMIDDLLVLTSATTQTNTNDTETPVDILNLVPQPFNGFPKVQLKGQILTTGTGLGIFPTVFPQFFPLYLNVTGTWGFGDGLSASPWDTALAATFTLTDSATTYAPTDITGLAEGQTLLLTTGSDSEQVYVSGVDYTTGVNTVTIKRGVNGTTAIAHTSASAQVALYPDDLIEIISRAAARIYETRQNAGIKSEKIGDYSYTLDNASGASGASGGSIGGYALHADERQSLYDSMFVRDRF